MSNPEIDEFGNKRWFDEQRNLHREDGPAVECDSGVKQWCLNGQYYSEQEFNEFHKQKHFTAEQARKIQSAISNQKAEAIVLNICKEILKNIENGSTDEKLLIECSTDFKTEFIDLSCKDIMIEKGFDVSINQNEDGEVNCWLIEISWGLCGKNGIQKYSTL